MRSYGNFKAKISLSVLERLKAKPNGKLICISSMTPTAAGEGKTCTAIGLTQALGLLKKKVMLCLREPSLVTVFGNKGGSTGAGYAQVLPADEINLHFTGDIHAIDFATNLLAAVIDNHRHHGNMLDIDPGEIRWKRSIAISDRELREAAAGDAKANLADRLSPAFDITPSSEIMAILSLAQSIPDLKKRLSDIIIGLSKQQKPIHARDLKAVGALCVLLKDALEPNLVQTMEGQPCLIHTGPFANISHGNNSILATHMGLKLADYVVTESGFGTDLGLEKFCNIVCPIAPFEPSVVVLVITVKALKSHSQDTSFREGFENLERHVENVRRFGLEPIVALNQYPTDTEEEVRLVIDYLNMRRIEAAVSNAVAEGGSGTVQLAEAVLRALAKKEAGFKPLYHAELLVEEKCRRIATQIYGADDVVFSEQAKKDLKIIQSAGLGHLPVNITKTPLSLSDNAGMKGAPKNWKLHIHSFRIYAGAGYLIALTGKALSIPGLPSTPIFEQMDLDSSGRISGVCDTSIVDQTE